MLLLACLIVWKIWRWALLGRRQTRIRMVENYDYLADELTGKAG